MQDSPEKNNKKFSSYFSVGIVIVFGYFFISSILRQEAPTDEIEKWWTTIWGIFAMCLGVYHAIFARQDVQKQIKTFEKWNATLHFRLFPTKADQFNVPFARAMGLLFFVIGAILVIRNLIAFFT